MILCVENISPIWLFKKPFDFGTSFNSGCKKLVMKYLGKYKAGLSSLHLYIDLVSGGYFWYGSELENSIYEIVWRLE